MSLRFHSLRNAYRCPYGYQLIDKYLNSGKGVVELDPNIYKLIRNDYEKDDAVNFLGQILAAGPVNSMILYPQLRSDFNEIDTINKLTLLSKKSNTWRSEFDEHSSILYSYIFKLKMIKEGYKENEIEDPPSMASDI